MTIDVLKNAMVEIISAAETQLNLSRAVNADSWETGFHKGRLVGHTFALEMLEKLEAE